jgi:putative FmdB family regulatory protein
LAELFSCRMPIYEYECTACAKVSSHVMMGSRRRPKLACPACGAGRLKRVMSSFAVVASESSRLAAFDTSRPRDESFYRDSRNVGLWAKKRAKELGADLGNKFEETVEKARSGKLVKEML